MSKKEQQNKSSIRYKDYITIQPKNVISITDEEMTVANEHYKIISALREKPMTVKEIHNLYYDEKTQKYSRTIKTIYRYLEMLENTKIVMVVGHRIKDGSRVTEKLYARTSKVFILEKIEINKEIKEKNVKMLMKLISVFFVIEREKEKILIEFLSKFFDFQSRSINELFNLIRNDHQLIELISRTDIDTMQCLSDLAVTFTFFIMNSDIMGQIKAIIQKKIDNVY